MFEVEDRVRIVQFDMPPRHPLQKAVGLAGRVAEILTEPAGVFYNVCLDNPISMQGIMVGLEVLIPCKAEELEKE